MSRPRRHTMRPTQAAPSRNKSTAPATGAGPTLKNARNVLGLALKAVDPQEAVSWDGHGRARLRDRHGPLLPRDVPVELVVVRKPVERTRDGVGNDVVLPSAQCFVWIPDLDLFVRAVLG